MAMHPNQGSLFDFTGEWRQLAYEPCVWPFDAEPCPRARALKSFFALNADPVIVELCQEHDDILQDMRRLHKVGRALTLEDLQTPGFQVSGEIEERPERAPEEIVTSVEPSALPPPREAVETLSSDIAPAFLWNGRPSDIPHGKARCIECGPHARLIGWNSRSMHTSGVHDGGSVHKRAWEPVFEDNRCYETLECENNRTSYPTALGLRNHLGQIHKVRFPDRKSSAPRELQLTP